MALSSPHPVRFRVVRVFRGSPLSRHFSAPDLSVFLVSIRVIRAIRGSYFAPLREVLWQMMTMLCCTHTRMAPLLVAGATRPPSGTAGPPAHFSFAPLRDSWSC